MAGAPGRSPYPLDTEPPADRGADPSLRGRTVFFDGVFKGDYSLAVVNRQLARALIDDGVDLTCHTPEQDWQRDPLLSAAKVVKMRMRDDLPAPGSVDVHLRNTWPPATRDMVGAFNAYVCFAWEEAELPPHLVERFNRDLDLMMVTSHFVRDAFRHSGVMIPIEVVGNGCDHVLEVEAAPSPLPPTSRARILHVSSGFARKGPDRLVEAFLRSFRRDDPVELVIKTFPNPDNVIPSVLRDAAPSLDGRAPIVTVEASYSHAELVGLYKTAAMVVAPSRGEGFGLPLAEAMALGVPVVTTGYSGQLDFCSPDTAWLVDYALHPSRAHVAGSFSLWADPSADHLGAQMRAVLNRPEEARRRTDQARSHLTAHFTWRAVSRRVRQALANTPPRAAAAARAAVPWSLDLVSSWQQRCGIASYAGHLYDTPALAPHLSAIFARRILDDALEGVTETAGSRESPSISRLWGYDFPALVRLAGRLETGRADVLWIQHHPGHFSNPDMDVLVKTLQTAQYKVRAITLHSVREALRGGPLGWISAFDIVFVHSAEDAALVWAEGGRNPVVIPHGFRAIEPRPSRQPDAGFVVGSFGFLAPHKNIDRLVVAFAHARRFCPQMKLKLLNCAQPDDASRRCRSIVETLIEHLGISDSVTARFDFIPEDELVGELADCDVLAFPYGHSNETATGAARIAISSDRPLLCSRSPVLRDLWPVSHVLRTDEIDCITEALVSLAQNADLRTLHDPMRRKLAGWYAYPRLAERYAGHIEKHLRNDHDRRHAA